MAMLFSGMKSLLLSIPKSPSSPFSYASLRFFPSSAPSISPILHFLDTDCAFSPPQISKIINTRKSLLTVKSTQTARQAVEFLRECKFTHSQLHNAILRDPSLLSLSVPRKLKPMFDFLTTLGFTNQDLRYIIARRPRLVGCSLDTNIKPRIPFLQSLFGSKDNLIKGLKRAPELLIINVDKQLKPKIQVLKQCGIENELLSLFLSISSSELSRTPIGLFQMRVEYVRNTLGVVEGSKLFVYLVHLLVAIGPQIFEKKVEHLESLGLLKEEVQQLLKKQPFVFHLSMDKMQRNMDFLIHSAGFQPNVVLSNGRLMHFSVEERLKPRLAVFQALCAMQQPTPNLSRMLSVSEKTFLQKVVECSPHASILTEIYQRKVENSIDVETTNLASG